MISDTEFNLVKGGHNMTLIKETDIMGDHWAMYTVNAAVRAYNRGYSIPKYFLALADVEKKYKSWNGIGALVAA